MLTTHKQKRIIVAGNPKQVNHSRLQQTDITSYRSVRGFQTCGICTAVCNRNRLIRERAAETTATATAMSECYPSSP